MGDFFLPGVLIGSGAVTLITVLMVPWKLWASKRSALTFLKVSAVGVFIRFLAATAIAFWGFGREPLLGLTIIFSFGISFLVLAYYEVRIFAPKGKRWI